MNNYLKKIALFLFILLVSSCKPTLNYIGNNFESTKKVQIFYDSKDILKSYTVKGLLHFEYNALVLNMLNVDVSSLIISKGREVGADAVLITRFINYTKQVIEENIITKEKELKDIKNNYIEAKILKYKNNF